MVDNPSQASQGWRSAWLPARLEAALSP